MAIQVAIFAGSVMWVQINWQGTTPDPLAGDCMSVIAMHGLPTTLKSATAATLARRLSLPLLSTALLGREVGIQSVMVATANGLIHGESRSQGRYEVLFRMLRQHLLAPDCGDIVIDASFRSNIERQRLYGLLDSRKAWPLTLVECICANTHVLRERLRFRREHQADASLLDADNCEFSGYVDCFNRDQGITAEEMSRLDSKLAVVVFNTDYIFGCQAYTRSAHLLAQRVVAILNEWGSGVVGPVPSRGEGRE